MPRLVKREAPVQNQRSSRTRSSNKTLTVRRALRSSTKRETRKPPNPRKAFRRKVLPQAPNQKVEDPRKSWRSSKLEKNLHMPNLPLELPMKNPHREPSATHLPPRLKSLTEWEIRMRIQSLPPSNWPPPSTSFLEWSLILSRWRRTWERSLPMCAKEKPSISTTIPITNPKGNLKMNRAWIQSPWCIALLEKFCRCLTKESTKLALISFRHSTISLARTLRWSKPTSSWSASLPILILSASSISDPETQR